MRHAQAYFNSHANMNRVDHEKWCGVCRPEPIKAKDEKAYSLALEKAADRRRKVKVSLPELPF